MESWLYIAESNAILNRQIKIDFLFFSNVCLFVRRALGMDKTNGQGPVVQSIGCSKHR